MTITRFITAFSRERIQPYQDYVKLKYPNALPTDISQKALDLYIWNIQVSSALLEIISLYEVTLRNKIFNVIDNNLRFSIQNRGFRKSFPDKTQEKFDSVERKIIEEGKTVTNHLIVSRLSFSIWNAILIRHMKNQNSPSNLFKHRKDIFAIHVKNPDYWIRKLISVNSNINKLRNRVCHHEHLLNQNIGLNYLKMLAILRKLDPNVFTMVKQIQRVTNFL